MKNLFYITLITTLFTLPTAVVAEIEISQSLDGLTPEEKAWLLDDSNLDAMMVASEDLVWSDKATKDSYWLKNNLKINNQSIKTGWIEFSQCHFKLDAINKIEVAYQPDLTRNIKVLSYKGIEHIKVENSGVVLNNVSSDAQICISGESKTLKTIKNGFSIQRGPYMRKFLDGYYPMIVEESIEFDNLTARLTKHLPTNPLKRPDLNQATYDFSYSFEGQLRPYYQFSIPTINKEN
ncbi:MAG TPA: hypothetical protein ENK73_06685 [Thiomicrospira sp.]|jgi:hypothetical protein|nr:hypothetical protein [Thiomicrospira sp.]